MRCCRDCVGFEELVWCDKSAAFPVCVGTSPEKSVRPNRRPSTVRIKVPSAKHRVANLAQIKAHPALRGVPPNVLVVTRHREGDMGNQAQQRKNRTDESFSQEGDEQCHFGIL